MQGRKGADADPTGCGSIRDRNIVNLVRELEEQLHARRGSPELEPRKPRGEGSNESIATVPIFMAGTNNVALVLACRQEAREGKLIDGWRSGVR
jgi:hypothetical protein